MTIKELIKLEDAANEVWVISPTLNYDIENKDFNELVSVNLGQETKYRYIVPATEEVLNNIEKYKEMYDVDTNFIRNNFLMLEQSEFNPFIMETAIYNASEECTAFSAPPMEGTTEVIQYDSESAKKMATSFKEIWKKYMRKNP